MADICDEIRKLWPTVHIVHGRARHSQSQGGIERLNRTCLNKLGSWMTDQKTKQWSLGRLFVKFQINRSFSEAIGTNPYRLVFGQVPSPRPILRHITHM